MSTSDITHCRRLSFFALIAKTAIIALLLNPTLARASSGKELSFQFQGLGANVGGTPVLGGRFRWQNWEGSIHSFSYDGLAVTGAWRTLFRENSLISPSLNLSVRRLEGDILLGPGLSIALTVPFFGIGRVGIRLDNELFYSVQSGSFEPEYLLGFTYIIPGGGR